MILFSHLVGQIASYKLQSFSALIAIILKLYQKTRSASEDLDAVASIAILEEKLEASIVEFFISPDSSRTKKCFSAVALQHHNLK